MPPNPTNPLIVLGDRTILLECANPKYEEARDALNRFAELVKSPEHMHTYQLTPLSLWNAAAADVAAEEVVETLNNLGKYDVPGNIATDIRDYISRYGRLKLVKDEAGRLLLTSEDKMLITEVWASDEVRQYLTAKVDGETLEIHPERRGFVKQALVSIGFPAEDLAGYVDGEHLDISLLERMERGQDFHLRDYQKRAGEKFWAQGGPSGGSGVVVLPCGAGKTVVGISIMAEARCSTLIVTPNIIAARQWASELLDKTNLGPEMIGEYSGEFKEIKPVTISTYQILTWRRSGDDEFPHFDLFKKRNWGLIVYDEVHLLPAPVFKITAEIQARRRLGLTATLVREDGHERDVFSLIGPKRYDAPWKDLEKQGWIATAVCREIRVDMAEEIRYQYAVALPRQKYRVATENPAKVPVIQKLLSHHKDDKVLIIGQYLDQLEKLAKLFRAPLISGKMPNDERRELYDEFLAGKRNLLVVSKVANFALDLPDASVAIQVSGTYGSRQEEAQRLGRILRPKEDGKFAHFYTVVTRDSRDQEFNANRQLFLTEQGYRYEIWDASSLNEKLAAGKEIDSCRG